jgi:hypothetical protein
MKVSNFAAICEEISAYNLQIIKNFVTLLEDVSLYTRLIGAMYRLFKSDFQPDGRFTISRTPHF